MRELTVTEINHVGGGLYGISSMSVAQQMVALNGLASGGAYLWGNIINNEQSTLAGFSGNMLGGMAGGAIGNVVSKPAVGAVTTAYGSAAVGKAVERLVALGTQRLENALEEAGL